MADNFGVGLDVKLEDVPDMWPLVDVVRRETWECIRENSVTNPSTIRLAGSSRDDKSFSRPNIAELRTAFQRNHTEPSSITEYIVTDSQDVSLISLSIYSWSDGGGSVHIDINGHDRMAVDRFGRDLHIRLSNSRAVASQPVKEISIKPLSMRSHDGHGIWADKGIKKNVANTESTIVSRAVKNEIFIVHGHDELARLQVSNTLQQLTGLTPIVLHEQRSGGKTVIEKLQEAAAKAVCAVVLLTPDDFGGKEGGSSNPRARQNVVFEHGYFSALLGRENVIALTKGGVELPSDINGVVYISMETEGWKLQLATELRGIPALTVDSNGLR
tara:strand:+ start:31 stop:1017 length:987 start_codon:yes stop_codon:yes gene_type:complete